MITREKEPPNLEMLFSALDSFVTPNEGFYVRWHFPSPNINERDWRLKVEGKVARPFEVTMDDLRQMPTQTITVTLECAGNSRVFLVPKVKGVQWELGAVGNAEWTGVRLRELLQRAEVANNAREIILEGADNGTIAEPPRPAGKINFARSLPLEKAMDDVLLALAMNGEPLKIGRASCRERGWSSDVCSSDLTRNGPALDYANSCNAPRWRTMRVKSFSKALITAPSPSHRAPRAK